MRLVVLIIEAQETFERSWKVRILLCLKFLISFTGKRLFMQGYGDLRRNIAVRWNGSFLLLTLLLFLKGSWFLLDRKGEVDLKGILSLENRMADFGLKWEIVCEGIIVTGAIEGLVEWSVRAELELLVFPIFSIDCIYFIEEGYWPSFVVWWWNGVVHNYYYISTTKVYKRYSLLFLSIRQAFLIILLLYKQFPLIISQRLLMTY